MRGPLLYPGVPIPSPRLVQTNLTRPDIPIEAQSTDETVFVPSREWAQWIVATFIAREGAFHNPDHEHLEFANIGVLWTSAPNRRHMLTTLAEAEMPNPRGGAWQVARQKYQLTEWFGEIPDFLITFSGEHLPKANDRTLCAVIEHELYHCAQRLDQFGSPKFHEDNSPVFGIKGHDVEEFIGVARIWGLRDDLRVMLEQAAQQPKIPDDVISGVCGTCMRKAA